MKRLTLLFLYLLQFSVFAQDTTYFSSERALTLLPEKAKYFTIDSIKQVCKITLFSMKDKSKFATFNFKKSNLFEGFEANGYAVMYYPNGNVQMEGNFENEQKKGTWKEFYESGKPKEVVVHDIDLNIPNFYEKHLLAYRVLEYWDNLGLKSVNDGNGLYFFRDSTYIFTVDLKNGIPHGTCGGSMGEYQFTEKFKNGELVEGVSKVDGKDIKYDKIEEQPEYKTGIQGIYRLIGENIKYPKIAQKANVQGKVFVKFVINKEGRLETTETEVLKGIGYGCDEEAVRVVNLLGKFSPGKQSGRNVRVWYTLPVNYKLE